VVERFIKNEKVFILCSAMMLLVKDGILFDKYLETWNFGLNKLYSSVEFVGWKWKMEDGPMAVISANISSPTIHP
jgi:hypothetical protein